MEKYELDVFHDTIYSSTGKSLNYNKLTELVKILPKDILAIGLQWGFSDTEFKDLVHEWIKTINV